MYCLFFFWRRLFFSRRFLFDGDRSFLLDGSRNFLLDGCRCLFLGRGFLLGDRFLDRRGCLSRNLVRGALLGMGRCVDLYNHIICIVYTLRPALL